MQNVPQRLAFLGHNTMQPINLLEQECKSLCRISALNALFISGCLVKHQRMLLITMRRTTEGPLSSKPGAAKLLRGQRATVTIQAQHNSLKMGIFQVFTYNMGIQCPYSPTIPLRKYLAQHLKTHICLAANVLQGFRKIWNGSLAWHLETKPLNHWTPELGTEHHCEVDWDLTRLYLTISASSGLFVATSARFNPSEEKTAGWSGIYHQLLIGCEG